MSHLEKKTRRGGRWNLDAVRPDLDNNGKWADWWARHKTRFHPFALERVRHPSKMITLNPHGHEDALTGLRQIVLLSI